MSRRLILLYQVTLVLLLPATTQISAGGPIRMAGQPARSCDQEWKLSHHQIVFSRGAGQSGPKEHERRAVREQFKESFRDLQLLGIGLLKAHERRELRGQRLAKDTKSIQRRAKTLRNLMVLGEPSSPPEQYDRALSTPGEFDKSIKKLAALIHSFAHNPIHKNTKVFNTDQAAQALADLINIINLAKLIEDRASSYDSAPIAGRN